MLPLVYFHVVNQVMINNCRLKCVDACGLGGYMFWRITNLLICRCRGAITYKDDKCCRCCTDEEACKSGCWGKWLVMTIVFSAYYITVATKED